MIASNTKSEFYLFRISSGNSETGNVFPQCQSMNDGYNHDGVSSYRKMKHDIFPDFVPDFDHFILHKRAKLTHFLSKVYPYFGLLLNQEVKEVLSKFTLPEHKYYNVSVKKGDKIHNDYYLLHIICNLIPNYDFSKSSFYISELLFDNKYFKVNNEKELNGKQNEALPFGRVCIEKLHFKRNYFPKYDMFYLSPSDIDIFISHNLKTALEEANITGIEIVPTDVI